jgi:hypothetical protein
MSKAKPEYRCVRPCWFKGKLYKPGEVIVAYDIEKDLPHGKKGEIRHFVAIEDYSEQKVAEVAIEDRKAAKSKGAKLNPQKTGEVPKPEPEKPSK